ncbi:unnamed protein product, partial [Symbiodinium sp. KB8]
MSSAAPGGSSSAAAAAGLNTGGRVSRQRTEKFWKQTSPRRGSYWGAYSGDSMQRNVTSGSASSRRGGSAAATPTRQGSRRRGQAGAPGPAPAAAGTPTRRAGGGARIVHAGGYARPAPAPESPPPSPTASAHDEEPEPQPAAAPPQPSNAPDELELKLTQELKELKAELDALERTQSEQLSSALRVKQRVQDRISSMDDDAAAKRTRLGEVRRLIKEKQAAVTDALIERDAGQAAVSMAQRDLEAARHARAVAKDQGQERLTYSEISINNAERLSLEAVTRAQEALRAAQERVASLKSQIAALSMGRSLAEHQEDISVMAQSLELVDAGGVTLLKRRLRARQDGAVKSVAATRAEITR